MREAYRSQRCLAENWLDVAHARELKGISELLDSEPRIYELAVADLSPNACGSVCKIGARGLSGEQVVRILIVKQMNGFSYRELAFHLADSRSYRTFCRIGIEQSSPKKSALCAAIKALTPETLEDIHRIIVRLATSSGVDRGTKLRADSTVTLTNIHHPTDSELLWDCVRVLTRLLGKTQDLLGPEIVSFNNRTRRAKKRRREINSARSKKSRIGPYRDLIRIADEVHSVATNARIALVCEPAHESSKLAQELGRYLELSRKVIDQSRRRVLQGETVPAQEKIVSLFEDHTDIIRKDARDTLYGHKVCLTAGSSSIVFDCQILDGNPPDSSLAVSVVQRHCHAYGGVPKQIAFDGGFCSRTNLTAIQSLGVEDVVFAKGRGLQISEMAKSTWVFKRLRNFRAGIEGIISFLKRAFGLDRCTWKSAPSFKSYVWSAIITSNLLITARHRL